MFTIRLQTASAGGASPRIFVRIARRTLALALVGAAALAGAGCATGVQFPDTALDTWTTDGTVYAVVHHNGRVYIGGNFDMVGPLIGHFAKIDAGTGAAVPFPEVNRDIKAIAKRTSCRSCRRRARPEPWPERPCRGRESGTACWRETSTKRDIRPRGRCRGAKRIR